MVSCIAETGDGSFGLSERGEKVAAVVEAVGDSELDVVGGVEKIVIVRSVRPGIVIGSSVRGVQRLGADFP